MADQDPQENEQSSFQKGIAEVNTAIGSSGRRSGKLDSLGYGLLKYPSDLESTNTGTGLLNWIQFTTYFKENGSLSSIAKKVGGSLGNYFGGGNDTGEENADSRQISIEQSAIGSSSNGLPSSQQDTVLSDSRLSRATSEAGDQVAIYLPGGIEYSDSLKYDEVSFAGLKNLSNVSAAAGSAALNVLRKLGGAVDKAGAIVGQESLNTGSALSAELGIVVNPRKEQMFQGVEFRSFSFKFVFIPRSREEAETVKKIIKLFRFHAYPELSANSAFFQFPSEFEIQFFTLNPKTENVEENKVLPKLKRCFLDKVETNFTPDDVYYFFQDGTPPRIEMSLSFKEAEYITRNHVKEGF